MKFKFALFEQIAEFNRFAEATLQTVNRIHDQRNRFFRFLDTLDDCFKLLAGVLGG